MSRTRPSAVAPTTPLGLPNLAWYEQRILSEALSYDGEGTSLPSSLPAAQCSASAASYGSGVCVGNVPLESGTATATAGLFRPSGDDTSSSTSTQQLFALSTNNNNNDNDSSQSEAMSAAAAAAAAHSQHIAASIKAQHERMRDFVVSVSAVSEIVHQKLYRQCGLSLEEYFLTRFKITRTQVYRLVKCAHIIRDICDGNIWPPPTKQRVCKTIAMYADTPGDRQRIWAHMLRECYSRGRTPESVTSRDVRDWLKPMLPALVAKAAEAGALHTAALHDDGDGDDGDDGDHASEPDDSGAGPKDVADQDQAVVGQRPSSTEPFVAPPRCSPTGCFGPEINRPIDPHAAGESGPECDPNARRRRRQPQQQHQRMNSRNGRSSSKNRTTKNERDSDRTASLCLPRHPPPPPAPSFTHPSSPSITTALLTSPTELPMNDASSATPVHRATPELLLKVIQGLNTLSSAGYMLQPSIDGQWTCATKWRFRAYDNASTDTTRPLPIGGIGLVPATTPAASSSAAAMPSRSAGGNDSSRSNNNNNNTSDHPSPHNADPAPSPPHRHSSTLVRARKRPACGEAGGVGKTTATKTNSSRDDLTRRLRHSPPKRDDVTQTKARRAQSSRTPPLSAIQQLQPSRPESSDLCSLSASSNTSSSSSSSFSPLMATRPSVDVTTSCFAHTAPSTPVQGCFSANACDANATLLLSRASLAAPLPPPPPSVVWDLPSTTQSPASAAWYATASSSLQQPPILESYQAAGFAMANSGSSMYAALAPGLPGYGNVPTSAANGAHAQHYQLPSPSDTSMTGFMSPANWQLTMNAMPTTPGWQYADTSSLYPAVASPLRYTDAPPPLYAAAPPHSFDPTLYTNALSSVYQRHSTATPAATGAENPLSPTAAFCGTTSVQPAMLDKLQLSQLPIN